MDAPVEATVATAVLRETHESAPLVPGLPTVAVIVVCAPTAMDGAVGESVTDGFDTVTSAESRTVVPPATYELTM